MLFYNNPDVIKNAMLIADEITLVVPMSGIDTHELFLLSFNSPPENNPATAIDQILNLANQKIIKIENGFSQEDTHANNVRKLYGTPYILKSNKLTELIIQAHQVIQLAKDKEAIILNDFTTYHSKESITEKRKLIKSEILKNCIVHVPDFARLDFEEIAKIKSTYQDEFLNAQIYINSLSFDLMHDLKDESTDEQIKYIEGYVKEVLNPQITVLIKALKKSNNTRTKSIIRKIVKLIPLRFMPISPVEALGEAFKTVIDITKDFDKKDAESEKNAFLNIMVKSYKK